MKRVFWIVADSFGMGAQGDSGDYGDAGANTLRSVRQSPLLDIPCMDALGLRALEKAGESACGLYGKMTELSKGKDTVTGHWEMCGLVSRQPFPTYPQGFPPSVMEAFCKAIGRGALCNKPCSGTKVLEDYGMEHLQTGCPIVYTSADSVFQIAAHTDVISVPQLYDYCRKAREILQGEHAVGRVIARPFDGAYPFHRTGDRRDFPLPPPEETVLDCLKNAGLSVLAVGKIGDIFHMQGITEHIVTHNNQEGMEALQALFRRDFHGLCFANLVDFDMLYGHRRDVDGYARALTALDGFLSRFLTQMHEDDLLILTGDHGCDPAYMGTDHTREFVPLLIYNKKMAPRSLGTRETFADLGAAVAAVLGVPWTGAGTPFWTQEELK